jgi:hypothetical protein
MYQLYISKYNEDMRCCLKSENFLPQSSQRIFTKDTKSLISIYSFCVLCDFFVFVVVKNNFETNQRKQFSSRLMH